MSGGAFDHQQWHIRQIAENIESELERQGKPKPKAELWCDEEYYKKYPGELVWYTYSKEVQRQLRKAVKVLKQAYVYAQRADYLFSGDDGEESFLKRLEEELRALK